MQAYTHFLVGVYLHLHLMELWEGYPVALVAFLHHPILDILAVMTYHPAHARKDWFWALYHLWIWIWAVAILIRFSEYWWVCIWSVAIDIWDWGLIRPFFPNLTPLHTHLHHFRDKLPLPDWTESWWAASFELALGIWIWNQLPYE